MDGTRAVSLPFRLKPAEFAAAYQRLPEALRSETARGALATYRRGEVWFGPCSAPGKSLLEALPVDVLFYIMRWRLGQLARVSKTLRVKLCDRVERQRLLEPVTIGEVTSALNDVLTRWRGTLDEVMPEPCMCLSTFGASSKAECRTMTLQLLAMAVDASKTRALITTTNVELERCPGWVDRPMGGLMSHIVPPERVVGLVLSCVCGGRDELLLGDGSMPVLNVDALIDTLKRRRLRTSLIASRTLEYVRGLAIALDRVPWTSAEELTRVFPRELPLREDATEEQLRQARRQLEMLYAALLDEEPRWLADVYADPLLPSSFRARLSLPGREAALEHLSWLRDRFCALVLDREEFAYEGVADLWPE
jgi:hypothetical protein